MQSKLEEFIKMQQNNIDAYVAERLKMIRKIRGITLKNIAGRMGISCKQMQNYETCNCAISLVRLQQLAEILNVNVGYFVDGIEEKKNSLTNEDLRLVYKLRSIKDSEVKKNICELISGL